MTITTRHSSSSYGQPVILDDDGNPMDYAAGIKAIRAKHGLSTADLAAIIGGSPRTVENWETGTRMPNAAALNAIGNWLEDQAKQHGGDL